MLGISLAIAVSSLQAQVELENLETEYQSAKDGHVTVPLTFINRDQQSQTVTGSWQWISFQQQVIATGKINPISLDARQTLMHQLKLPVGQSTHYKLVFDWKTDNTSQQSILDITTDAPQAQTPTLLLSGAWEEAQTKGFWPFEKDKRDVIPDIPSDLKFKDVDLPRNVGATSDKAGKIHWYRKQLSLPNWLRGQRYELQFDGIGKRAHIWVNDQHIAYLEGAWTTYRFDVTDALKVDGENQILIAAADHTAQKQDPSRGEKFNWPVGHSGNALAGVYDHCYLRATSDTSIDQWQWQLDHDKNQLQIKALLINKSTRQLSDQAKVQVQLIDGDQPAFVAEQSVNVAAGSQQLVIINMDITKAKRWWPAMTDAPGTPFLYGLQINLKQGDQLINQIHDRIGLRSIEVKNGLYVINGIPIHPVARGMGGWTGARTWANARKAIGSGYGDISRIHCNPLTINVVQAADESGHLIQLETPLTASGYQYPLDDPDFWENFRTQTGKLIDTYRNLTSVVSMSLSNEVFLCGAERYPKALDQMAGVWRWATDRTPGWPVVVNGDGDLRGRIATNNLHYPRHLSRHPLLPTAAYWLKQDVEQKLDLYPGSVTWKKNQLMEIGEDQWDGFSAWPHGCSIIAGDQVYASDEAALAGHDAAAIQYMLGYRDANVAYHQPWAKTSDRARTYANHPIAAYLMDQYATTQPGSEITWSVNVFNDSLAKHQFKLNAKSSVFDVTLNQNVVLDPAQKQRVTLRIKVPEKLADADVPWQLTLTDESGLVRFTDEHTLRIRNRVPIKQPASPLYVLQGDGQLVNLLKQNKLSYQKITGFKALSQIKDGLLLVGANASLQACNSHDRIMLAEFAQRGGKVVFFKQDQYPSWSIVPARISQDTGHDATLAHVVSQSHPILAGLSSEDFQYWPDGHTVSEHDFYKPQTDGTVALLATGGRIGLAWSPLMYIPSGKGWIVMSQLDMLKQFNGHPTPSRLLANLFALADQSTSQNTGKLYLLGQSPAWEAAFEKVGVICQTLQTPDELAKLDTSSWLLIPDGQWASQWVEPVMQYVQKGGKLWLMDWQSPGFDQLDQQYGIRPLKRDLKDFSLALNNTHPYLKSLTGYDCFWAQPTQGDPQAYASIARLALVDYDPQCTRIELSEMKLDTAGTSDGLSSWGVPEGYQRVYNFKNTQQKLQWTVPADKAGTYYVGVQGRVAHRVPKKVKQLSVAYLSEPFSWSLARHYTLERNGESIDLQTSGDHVQIPVVADDWAMPYGSMVSFKPFTLNAGDVLTIGVKDAGSQWVAGLDLYQPRTQSRITSLTQPAVLNVLQVGQGQILLDGINWQGGFEHADRLATVMLNNLSSGLGVTFKAYQPKLLTGSASCKLMADDAVLTQESGAPKLHIDGTRSLHAPYRNAVALKEPGQWAQWTMPDTLPAGAYQLRVVARVSNTSPKSPDLAKHYVFNYQNKVEPLLFDRGLGEPFVALQANGWAVVYGTLRSENLLSLKPGDVIAVGLNKNATGFLPQIQLVHADDLVQTRSLKIAGGLPIKLNRTIHVNWAEIDQTLTLETSTALCKDHMSLDLEPTKDKFKRLYLAQSFYHPWTDFAGQSADKPVARCTVTYADGTSVSFDMIYYQHVTMPLDAQPTLPQAKLLWQDRQPYDQYLDDLTGQKGRWIQMQHPTPIYGMHWDNPHPEKSVKQIHMQMIQGGVLSLFDVRAQ
jgi:hypothetical protein